MEKKKIKKSATKLLSDMYRWMHKGDYRLADDYHLSEHYDDEYFFDRKIQDLKDEKEGVVRGKMSDISIYEDEPENAPLVVKWKKLHPNAQIPTYGSVGAAAFDLSAAFDCELTMHPGAILAIPTGLAVELPMGYELQVRARSGLALKVGFSLVNGVGTIDSDYRGEICVIATLLGSQPWVVRSGDRIAQGLVFPVLKVQHCESEELSSTLRDTKGFGSTGV